MMPCNRYRCSYHSSYEIITEVKRRVGMEKYKNTWIKIADKINNELNYTLIIVSYNCLKIYD